MNLENLPWLWIAVGLIAVAAALLAFKYRTKIKEWWARKHPASPVPAAPASPVVAENLPTAAVPATPVAAPASSGGTPKPQQEKRMGTITNQQDLRDIWDVCVFAPGKDAALARLEAKYGGADGVNNLKNEYATSNPALLSMAGTSDAKLIAWMNSTSFVKYSSKRQNLKFVSFADALNQLGRAALIPQLT